VIEFTLWDIVRNLLLAARWTILLSAVAFAGGTIVGLVILFMRISKRRPVQRFAEYYIGLFQGTPLLMQLFLLFFGLPLLGLRIEPWTAAVLGLTLCASAFLAEIWRGWRPGGACWAMGCRQQPRAALSEAVTPDYPAAGLCYDAGADRRVSGAADQEHRADVDHRFRGTGQNLERDQQCHL